MSYEVIRFLSRHCNKLWARIFLMPGLFIQNITTREPDDKQIEVATAALNAVLEAEKNLDSKV